MSSQPSNFWRRLLGLGAAYPGLCALFIIIVSVAAGFGLPRLSMDAGFESLMARSVSDRQAYLEVTREFGSDSRSFLYLRDENLWTPAKLAALEKLHGELQQLPFVERIDDLFTAITIRGVDGELNAQPLLAHAPSDDQGAENARAAALEDPIAVRNLVSADGKSLAIGISTREAAPGGEEGIYNALEQVISQAHGDFPSLLQVGPQRIQAETRRGVAHDLLLLGSISALLLAMAVMVLCRNAFCAVLALAAGSISLLWTFGLMGILSIPLNILFVMLPPLLFAVGSIEIVRLAFQGGLADEDVVERAARSFGATPVITALVLVLGFASQAFSGVGIVRDFGLAAAFAILANWLATILLLPLLARVFGTRADRSRSASLPRFLSGVSAYASRLLQGHLLSGALALAALAGAVLVLAIPNLRVTHDPLAFFRADSAIVQAADRMHDELAGANILYITLDANAEGAFRDPANLRRLADIQAFLAKQEIFDRSLSLADIVSQANREASGGRSEAYEVSPTRKLVGQYLVLHRPQDLEPYISHDFRRANIVVRHNVRDASTLNHHIREMHSAIAHYAGPSMTTAVIGNGVSINAAADRLTKTEAAVLAALLAFIMIAISLMFTSEKGGVIAMALSAIPLLLILGGMGGLGMPANVGTAMAAVVAVAVTIQGTSRLFSRYSQRCRHAAVYDAAADEAVRQEEAPIAAVGLVLVAGFSALLFSGFQPIVQFGLLVCAASLLAGIVNVVIAPAVLSHIRLVGLYEMLALSMQREALEGCPLFAGLNSYQIRKTILISELREYGDGERLIEQGTVDRSMFVIVSGQVEVVRHGEGGDQRFAVLKPGNVFGEIGFVHETFRTADVRALGAVSVLRFDHDRLKKDLALFPHIMAKLNFNISGILGRRLAELVAGQAPVVTDTKASSVAPLPAVPDGNGPH